MAVGIYIFHIIFICGNVIKIDWKFDLADIFTNNKKKMIQRLNFHFRKKNLSGWDSVRLDPATKYNV